MKEEEQLKDTLGIEVSWHQAGLFFNQNYGAVRGIGFCKRWTFEVEDTERTGENMKLAV